MSVDTGPKNGDAFFIVGCSRSGTTLLQALIDGHPNLAIPPESQIYSRFGAIFHTYGNLERLESRMRFIEALLRDAYIREWRLDATPEDVERRLARHDRAGVVAALFSLYAEQSGAAHWGDKTPEHIRHMAEIRRDFPNAKLIHLVRDGRDVAEAMRRMIWGPVSAYGLAHEWRREVMHWESFVAAHGSAGTMIVRYEDLVTSPRETLARVLEFIGEPFVDTVSTYTSTPLTQNLATTQSTWHSSLGQGISASKVGVYRQRFSAREIEIFEAVAGDVLSVYGYPREYPTPRPATWRDRGRAFIADRAVRWSRKLVRPHVLWLEIQFRLRLARRWLHRVRSRP